MFNTSTVIKTKSLPVVEYLTVSGGTFTLTNIPSGSVTPTIFKVDTATGKELKPALVAGTPATNVTDYSISGKIVTCHSSVTKIAVSYNYDVEVEALEMADSTPKNWEAVATIACKEIETGALYKAWLELPNISILPNSKLSAVNASGAPDPIDLTIDLMVGADGYPYAIDFVKEA